MSVDVSVLIRGFPGRADVSFLGWSTVALIQTDGKRILFDTGAHGARPMLLEALKSGGLTTKDIDAVFLSHLHFDHCANITLFPHATFFLSRREWEYANTRDDVFVQEGVLAYLKVFDKTLLGDEETAIARDVTTLHTPGHTPGGTSLMIRQETETWGLTGDAVKNRTELDPALISMTQSAEDSADSIARVRARCARILPGHDCWLRLRDGKACPEERCFVNITLPAGLKGGDDGVFRLSVE